MSTVKGSLVFGVAQSRALTCAERGALREHAAGGKAALPALGAPEVFYAADLDARFCALASRVGGVEAASGGEPAHIRDPYELVAPGRRSAMIMDPVNRSS
jgi:hypothetical protein